MGNVKIATKAPAAAASKASTPAAKGAKAPAKDGAKKERKPRAPKPALEITLDDNNIPVWKNEDGSVIIGIPPKSFTAHLSDEQKKDRNVKHLATVARLEYMVEVAKFRLTEATEKKNPKKKLMNKFEKMKAKLLEMQKELGLEEEVEEVSE